MKKKKIPYANRGQVWMIPTGDIRPNPTQPRREFPLDKLVELAQSISENGILQPLTVSFETGEPDCRTSGGALRGGAGTDPSAAGADPG